ncbi:hypothetical protein HOC01_03870 [archaeon]|jgi:hypothetical protein|nr:hypothetical protein [archaeon]MBT6698449.1 hypothetical protein [archaeon]
MVKRQGRRPRRNHRKKSYTDKHGYKRDGVPHSNLTHRQVAYKQIYLKHRNKFPLPFSRYQVHHIDENKRNNRVSNLKIVTREEHEELHGITSSRNDWGYLRGLVGNRFTDGLVKTTRLSLIFSGVIMFIGVIISVVTNIDTATKITMIFLSISLTIFALSVLLSITLSTIGWIYYEIRR